MKTCIHVIHSLEYGGAQRDLYYYAKFHDRDRFRMEIVSFRPDGEMEDDIRSLGVKVHTLGTRSSEPASIFRLARIFRESGAGIVHFHNPLPVFSGVPASEASRVSVKVLTEHSINYSGRIGNSIKTALYEWLRRRIDVVIACSEEVRNSHIRSLDPERFITILNGVDLELFNTQSTDNTPGIFQIGCIGSLTPQKGYTHMVEAVSILSAKDVPVRLTFIGDGPLRSELEEQAEHSGLSDKISFTGVRKDIAGELGRFDIVAGSSLREGLPLGILEAMASGRAVVTTDVGGNREAVAEGVTGLLVPPADPEALALALESLWNDGEKRAAMGQAGRLRVEEYFSARDMVAKTERIYESIMLQGSGER
jgi:glycosyltransferase involved in cell wall biosynthesis